MKHLIFALPIILLAACASRTPAKVVIVPAPVPGPPMDALESVRRPEEVRQYRFGRYVDPGSRSVMHEAHPVYRIERTAGWNLRLDGSSKPVRVPASAVVSVTSPDDAVVAEINKQKLATKAFTEQTATLNQRLSGLAESVAQTQRMAEQQLLQQRDIAALKNRLNAVEREHAEKPVSPASQTSPATEETW